MNELFNTIFANTSSELTVSSAAVTMLAALLFGGADKTTTASSGGCAALEVADDGIGINAEDIPKIWERFYRVDASRTATDKQNMGLGLSIVSQIAAFHGGDVQVESEKGKVSKFTFKMPIADR